MESGLRLSATNEERRVDCGVERQMRLGEIVETLDIGALQQELPGSAAGERAPQLGWKQESQSRTGSEQSARALHEQRRHVDLRAETTARACDRCTRLPGSV